MQQSKILYLSDRTSLSDARIPDSLLVEMRMKGLVAPDMREINFCGVIPFDSRLAVFLPRNSSDCSLNKNVAAHNLLRALSKYYEDKDTAVFSQETGESVIGGKALSLITSLFEDYQLNGLYVRRVKEKRVNSGKVNWPKTISRSAAFPATNGVIYLDLHSTKSRYIANCETSRIHANVIKDIISTFGPIYLGNNSIIDERLEQQQKPIGTIEAQISYLKRELQLSYSERDIFLIKSLIQYLSDLEGEGSSKVIIGVRKFQGIWEAMLDKCLVGKYSVNSKLPIPVYETAGSRFVPVAQKGQRTDTVLKHTDNQRFAVVDAKYYRADSPSTAPGWPDLVKQFFYKEALAQVVGGELTITNHFVFPGNERLLTAAYVAERNKHIESAQDCLDRYAPIYCHYQDPLVLMDAYVNGKKLDRIMEEIFPNLEF